MTWKQWAKAQQNGSFIDKLAGPNRVILTSASGQSYAASKGFGHLSTLKAGEGFWVNASEAMVVP